MSDAADQSTISNAAKHAKVDVKASHVAREWKYSAPLLGARFDPTGRYVFAASMDHSIQRWDLKEDKHVSFAGHQSWARGVGFSADGSKMFSAGYDGKLIFWDAVAVGDGDSVRPIREIDAHAGWIRWVAVDPTDRIVATAGNDLTVKLWSVETGELLRTLKGHQKHVFSLLFHPDGELLLSGDLQGVVHQWEIASGKLDRSLEAKPLYTYHGGQQVDYGGVRCMDLNSDGRYLACGGLHKATNPFAGVQEPLVLILDWETGKQIRTHETTGIPRGIVWRLIFEPDGTLIGGIGGQEGYVAFWSDEKTEVHKIKLPSPVLDLDRHPLLPELAAVLYDGHVRLIRMGPKA